MIKNLYNRKEWILGQCLICGRLNYVEPHGMTAACKCSLDWTEHRSIPYAARVGMMGIQVDTAKVPKLTKESA